MKKIAVGDLGEFWYGDYKEPFEQLDGGVPGHPVGVVLKDDDLKPLCAYCGTTWHNLGNHVAHAHGMPARQYKAEVGLLYGASLVSESERTRMSALALRRGLGGSKNEMNSMRAKRTRYATGADSGMNRPEAKNKTGRCYSQVLAVARTIQSRGRRITAHALSSHGIGPTTVRTYFGSIEKLRAMVGAQAVLRRDWTDNQLLAVLRNLAEALGRPPQHSDLRRYGLPSANTYQRRFGGLRGALRQAGIDPNLPFAERPNAEVDVLVAYATTGSIHKTEAVLGTSQMFIEKVFAKYGAPFVVRLGGGRGTDSSARKEWAGEMARRLSGMAA